MSLVVSVEEKGKGLLRVALAGKLDSETAPACAERFKTAIKDDTRSLILDLETLSFISSMGIRVILTARKKLEAGGGVLTLVHVQPQVQKIFDIVAILPRENIFESMEEADRYFAAMQQKVLDNR